MSGQATFVLDETGKIAAHCFQIGNQGDAPPSPVPEPMVAPEARKAEPAPRQQVKTRDDVLSTRQLMKQLRARLRVVEREIKARAALEQERAQLKRLIAATKLEQDNVRRIRSAG